MFKAIIPNLLSFLRILLAIWGAYEISESRFTTAITLLCLAGITDFLDGYLARKLGVVSQFGGAFDPLADKILMFSVYIAAAGTMIPMLVAVVVITRDIIILLAVIACFIRKIKIKMAPLMSSKINTTVQIIYPIFVLACNCLQLHIPSISTVLGCVVVATTIWSGVEYVQKYQWIGRVIFKR